MTSLSCAAALGAALVSAATILRRRAVWRLGRTGDALAPAFLLLLWFAGLHLGGFSRSLAVMGWTAVAPLALTAVFALGTKTRRRSSSRRTWTDWYVLVLAGLLVSIFNGEDNLCHYSVISTVLRGNIPPSALNDPSAPLAYHWLFDAGAAFLLRALGVSHRAAIALVSLACLWACLESLRALSAALFEGLRARQIARLLFAFGFGPVYLRLLEPWPHASKPDFFLNGDMAQPFIESILRRPMGLNWTILLFMLAMALQSDAKKKAACLLPCAYLLPQASEELCLLGTAALFAAWIPRRVSWRLFAAWIAVLGASLPLSGVFQAMLGANPSAAVPHAALAWPWSLPDRDLALRANGLPLFSWKAVWTLLTEWGPLFLAGLYAGAADARRRPLVWVFAIGFFLACVLTLRGWNKFDLDRFLFYGTALGFLLCAAPLERLGRPAAWTLVLLTIAGPAGYALRSMVFNDADRPVSSGLILQRQKDLAAVGPKELILTDAGMAQDLVLAGFLVVAPMTSHWIGLVDKPSFDAYAKMRGTAADWRLLREAGGGYVLQRLRR